MFLLLLMFALGAITLHALYEYMMRKSWLTNIADNYVLVTGCDSGFGEALGRRLDGMGCHVLAGCLTQQGVDKLMESSSSRLCAFLLDVSKTDSIQAALDLVTKHIPDGQGLHGLVNNAGILAGQHWPPSSIFLQRQDLQEVLDVNLLGTADMMTAFLPLLIKAKGRVVNMSSAVARSGSMGFNVAYTISKSGIQCLSDDARVSLRQFGVKVCIIEPGGHATNMHNPYAISERLLRGFQRIPENMCHLLVTESEYKERLKKAFFNQNPIVNRDISPVIDAYTHALFSVHPKKRYSVGMDARLLFIPLSYAPSWLNDLFGAYVIARQTAKPWKSTKA